MGILSGPVTGAAGQGGLAQAKARHCWLISLPGNAIPPEARISWCVSSRHLRCNGELETWFGQLSRWLPPAINPQRSRKMTSIKTAVKNFVSNEDGAALVEYALLVALIAIVCILGVTFLGQNVSTKFSNIGKCLT
jgi:pilus assembly protein Flp/PilA